MTTSIAIAIVEDDEVFRLGLLELIDAAPDCRCVCACSTGEEAIKQVPRHKPDVVLMDIRLPRMSGIECTAHLKEAQTNLHVIMLTASEDGDRIFQALQAGASGYLVKQSDPGTILQAIREIGEGGAPMTRQVARRVVESFRKSSPKLPNLSKREREILDSLAQGYATKEVAHQLSISVNTIRTHLQHIYEKLQVRSRTEAVVKYLR